MTKKHFEWAAAYREEMREYASETRRWRRRRVVADRVPALFRAFGPNFDTRRFERALPAEGLTYTHPLPKGVMTLGGCPMGNCRDAYGHSPGYRKEKRYIDK